jgi:predicted metalloprotease with PDZ domain
MTPTRYRIVASDPNAHLFEVCCTVADPDPGGQAFRLPAWSPGSYRKTRRRASGWARPWLPARTCGSGI